MYWTFDVADVNGYGFWVFYYVLHVIGAQFMLNLVLGVLSGEFGKEGERLKVKEEFLAQKEENQAEVAEEAYSEWVDKGEESFSANYSVFIEYSTCKHSTFNYSR